MKKIWIKFLSYQKSSNILPRKQQQLTICATQSLTTGKIATEMHNLRLGVQVFPSCRMRLSPTRFEIFRPSRSSPSGPAGQSPALLQCCPARECEIVIVNLADLTLGLLSRAQCRYRDHSLCAVPAPAAGLCCGRDGLRRQLERPASGPGRAGGPGPGLAAPAGCCGKGSVTAAAA